MGNYFKNLIRGKTVAFYIGAVVAILSIVCGFIYTAAFINPENLDLAATYTAWIPRILVISGFLYFVAAIFKLDNYGLGLIGLSSFASLILFILNFVSYGLSVGNSLAMTEGENIVSALLEFDGILSAVIVLIFIIVIMIFANILAWIPTNSKKYKYENID